MKKDNPEIEQYRVTSGPQGSDASYGNNGVFIIRGPLGLHLICIASDGGGWDHVSVEVERTSPLPQRLPRWDEMCFIKSLFWGEDECVIEYHPAKKDYVNIHSFVLHLWRPQILNIPKPPKEFV